MWLNAADCCSVKSSTKYSLSLTVMGVFLSFPMLVSYVWGYVFAAIAALTAVMSSLSPVVFRYHKL